MACRKTTTGKRHTVLLVDDQEETLISVQMLLEREGHQVIVASSGSEALSLFRPGEVELVIVDYFMPGMTGEQLVAEIRKRDDDVQILLQTGYSGQKPPLEMLRSLSIQGYHDKSEGPDRLLLWVEVALKAHNQIQKVRGIERLKSELLANVSHELRTPLQVILGYTEVLSEDPRLKDSEVCRDVLDRIRRNASGLTFLINDFLAFAKAESERPSMVLRPVPLAELEVELREMMDLVLRDKPITFRWDIESDTPPVLAEPRQLVVILRNLLSNAAKFTEEGEIRIWSETDADGGRVRVHVRDTGPGIAPENHDVIFESFRQVDGSDARRFGGTGLGLALVRKLADLIRAEISLESRVGGGSTFTLSLVPAPVEPLRLETRPRIVRENAPCAGLA